jgi:hypothetical protein
MRRSRHHLDQLLVAHREVEAVNGHALPFEVHIRPGQTADFGQMVYPDSNWSLVAGDCIQNLRAALDHCVWELSSVRMKTDHPSDIEFPIFDLRSKYDRGKIKRLGGVHEQAIAIIDSLQPFAGSNGDPHSHPLWLLQVLGRIDRHRRIHVAFMAIQGSLMEREPAATEMPWTPVRGASRIDSSPGAGVRASITLAAVAPRPPRDFAIHASVDVRFVDSEAATHRGVFATLQQIAEIVEATLDRLQPFAVI